MIRTIRHKGLKRLFEQDDPSGVNPEHVGKLRNILATLNAAHFGAYGFAVVSVAPAQGREERLLGRYGPRQLAGDFSF
jgi:proteic killer suppression protein